MADTTTTTMTEAMPTIIAAAILQLEEGNVVEPLVTNIPFAGPGLVHATPWVNKLTAETDDDLASQAMDSTSGEEASPSSATVGSHGAYVLMKDLVRLSMVDDAAAMAGQLIGQSLVTRKDLDLVTLFSSFITNQGGVSTAGLAPADLYDAYGSLRKYFAPLPYNLALHPSQIWASAGISAMFSTSTDVTASGGPGTVQEDWAREGFAGRVMGFDLWSDANIAFTSANTAQGVGAAFSRAAIKNVIKRGLTIEMSRETADIGDNIAGSELRGEAILRNRHGNIMQFPLV